MNKKVLTSVTIASVLALVQIVFARNAILCNPNHLSPARFKQSGNKIKNLQACLIQHGYYLPSGATGYYGVQTKIAVKKLYLQELNLRQSGNLFGPQAVKKFKDSLYKGLPPKAIHSLPTLPIIQTPSVQSQATPPLPLKQSFITEADDSGANPSVISVNKNTLVEITFKVKSTGVYFGGLDFRSNVINTGTINPGQLKTIIFTADQSFDFVPYWPASNVRKPYTISIVVK